MASVLIAASGSVGLAASLTHYYPVGPQLAAQSTTESNKQITWRTAGVFSSAYMRVTANATTAASTYRFRVNGANGAQTFSIGAAATGEFEDTTNTDTVVATDEVTHQVAAGAGGTLTFSAVNVVFAATANTATVMTSGRILTVSTASVTQYIGLVRSGNNGSATETTAQTNMPVAGTLKNFFINVGANGRSTTTSFGSRKNAVNGALAISVGAAATGIFEDTSNSDTITAGDLVSFFFTNGTGTGNTTLIFTATFETTTNTGMAIAGAGDGNFIVASSTTGYAAWGAAATAVTELDTRHDANVAYVASRLWAMVITNPSNGTVRSRINGVNGNQLLTIGAAATGEFEDTTNSDVIRTTDEINLEIVNLSGAGTIVFGHLSQLVNMDRPNRLRLTSQAVNRSGTY